MVLIREIEEPNGGLVYKSDNIKLKIGEKIIGNGTLYISEDDMSWKPNDKPEGISILYKQIIVHGISNQPSKSVYFMLDHMLVWEGVYDPGANGNAAGPMEQDNDDSDNDEGNESDCNDEMTELWLIPNDITAVDQIFQTMKECQTLHPDSADSISEESDFMDAVQEQNEDDHEWGENGGNLQVEDEVGQGDMRNLNINEDRFDDAEDGN